jgi:CRISPR-associated protein (TIGR03986 family)
MSQVKSTYNFVPAPTEDQVFKPNWADSVSHDIPFEDGESGEIEVVITAETPIFIRNGYAKGTEDNEFSNAIINGEKKYFIPATSLKGMTRNVLEILSFSRLNKELVNDDKYSFRDLTKDSEYMKSYDTNKVKGGWLSEDTEGNWKIEECSINHIHHSDVDQILGTKFRDLYLEKQPEHKTAEAKYNLVNGKSLVSTFELKESKSKPKGLAIYDINGKKGTIVFTGQSGLRKEKNIKVPTGKVHEFVFFDGVKSTFSLSKEQSKEFRFIYSDHDKNNISKDWKFWREILEKGGKAPVFFNSSGNNIEHFGLSYMYKLPYKNSVHEMYPLFGYESNVDLATTLFGYTDKEASLKGRVYFGNAIAEKATPINTSKEILGGPKVSFTPFYLEQPNKNKVLTYQDKISIKGFKKYPIHSKIKEQNYSSDQLKNDKVFTYFTPLDRGATFRTKIKFHNLKQFELGALISALSFHNNSDKFSHSIGGAKSFGFGNIKIKILNIDKFKNALQVFEYEMDLHTLKKLNSKWIQTIQLKELFSMSSLPNSPLIEDNLVYPSIGKEGKNGNDDNEFIQIKKDKTFLESYSTINKIDSIESLLSKKVIDQWEEKGKEEEAKKDQLKIERENNFNLLIKKANDYLDKFEFDLAESSHKTALLLINDNSLPKFLEKIAIRKKEKIELDAYNLSITTGTVEGYENFTSNFPFSKFNADVSQYISKLKANSGVPQRILNLMEFDKFVKESDQWIKKLPNKKLNGSGFENEIEGKILAIGLSEISKAKTSTKWLNGVYLKKIKEWFGEEKAQKIIAKIIIQ